MTKSPVTGVKSGAKQPEDRIRVVLDTNVVVSATLSRGGMAAATLDLAVARKAWLYVSHAVLSEYEDVLRRPKFLRVPREIINNTLTLVRRIAIIVTPTERVSVSPDVDDNRFLECAEAAEADYLVTGNKRHFPTHWKKTRVVSAPEFVYAMYEQQKD